MADHIFTFKLKRDAIIAVMGLPYTFRHEMGRNIANWAECPNLKFEDILNALRNHLGSLINPSPSDPAFDILGETAVSLLHQRYQRSCVVINFPTPTNYPQLQRLLSVFSSYRHGNLRLLIIECQRRNLFRWRRDVELPDPQIWRLNPRYDTGNTEPGKWEDVEQAILNHQQQRLDASFLSLLPESPHPVSVKKLVVDPFEDLRSRDFTYKGLDRSSLFAEAIKCYLSCDAREYEALPANLDYSVWRRQWLEHRASSRGERKWCGAGDCILRFTTNKLHEESAVAICDACDEKLTSSSSTSKGEGAYYCQFCSLSLHPFCALALHKQEVTEGVTEKEEVITEDATAITATSTIPHSRVVVSYSFGDEHIFNKLLACYSCNKDGKSFSYHCDGCIFRTHLKCQLLPTAVNHSFEKDHILSIRLSWGPTENAVYDCKACGLRGIWSSYSCNICNSEYHLPCVLNMPLHTDHIPHGGHTHTLNIKFSCGQRELDEYEWCPVCYDDINPDTWVYTCLHCDFVSHLYCIFPSKLFRWYKNITQSQWTSADQDTDSDSE